MTETDLVLSIPLRNAVACPGDEHGEHSHVYDGGAHAVCPSCGDAGKISVRLGAGTEPGCFELFLLREQRPMRRGGRVTPALVAQAAGCWRNDRAEESA